MFKKVKSEVFKAAVPLSADHELAEKIEKLKLQKKGSKKQMTKEAKQAANNNQQMQKKQSGKGKKKK